MKNRNIMKKYIYVFGIVLIVMSCQNVKPKPSETVIIETKTTENSLVLSDTLNYVSASNDLAFIKLSIIPNGRFNFYMDVRSNSEENIITTHGTAVKENYDYNLHHVKEILYV